jgi:hypothetical protein
MPDYEGHSPAFYDHETEEPRATGRRRRQVADWGVGEDVFDRLPSRRFERRGEERRHAARHEDFRREAAEVRGDESWGDDEPRFARAWRDDDAPARRPEEPRFAAAARGDEAPVAPQRRRPAADWLAETAARDATYDSAPQDAENLASWSDADPARTIVIGGALEGEIAPTDTGERRTIVIGGAVEEEIPPRDEIPDAPAGPRERRTIVIGGHPDGLPVIRQRRPPRTAVERVGSRPDRFVAYTVAMGFLLILIAILTTGH